MLNYDMGNDFKHQKETINLFFNTKPFVSKTASPRSGKPIARNNGKDDHKLDNQKAVSYWIGTRNY